MLCLSQEGSSLIRKGRLPAPYKSINQCPLYMNIVIYLPAFPTTQRSFGRLFSSHPLYLGLSLSQSGRDPGSVTARLSGRAAIGFANEMMLARISPMLRFKENSPTTSLLALGHRPSLDDAAETYRRALPRPSYSRPAGSRIAWYDNVTAYINNQKFLTSL